MHPAAGTEARQAAQDRRPGHVMLARRAHDPFKQWQTPVPVALADEDSQQLSFLRQHDSSPQVRQSIPQRHGGEPEDQVQADV